MLRFLPLHLALLLPAAQGVRLEPQHWHRSWAEFADLQVLEPAPTVCTIYFATAKPKYAGLLDIIGNTSASHPLVRPHFLFNGNSSELSYEATLKAANAFCDRLPSARCLVVNSTCVDKWSCGGKVLYRVLKTWPDLAADCSWVVKQDPDNLLIPNRLVDLVKYIPSSRPVFFGNFGGRVWRVPGEVDVFQRFTMPVTALMWSKPVMRAVADAIREDRILFEGMAEQNIPANDELAIAQFIYWSGGASCVTNWGGETRPLDGRSELPDDLHCSFLFHKLDPESTVELYDRLSATGIQNDDCSLSGFLHMAKYGHTDGYLPRVASMPQDPQQGISLGYKFPDNTMKWMGGVDTKSCKCAMSAPLVALRRLGPSSQRQRLAGAEVSVSEDCLATELSWASKPSSSGQ